MSKLYHVKPEYLEDWKKRIDSALLPRITEEAFDIDLIVDLAKSWDFALQKMLSQVEVCKDDTD